MHDPNTHREIIAAVASLKSCVRGALLALDGGSGRGGGSTARLPGALRRAQDAAAALRRLLAGVADQAFRLPLETSKRLVEVELPELLVALLAAAAPGALWPAPPPPCTAAELGHASHTGDQAGHINGQKDLMKNTLLPNENSGISISGSSSGGGDASAGGVLALSHPAWSDVQALVADVFAVLDLLTGVAARACTRSSDPIMVLQQLAAPRVLDASALHMQRLWEALQQQQQQQQPLPLPGTASAAAVAAAEAVGGSALDVIAPTVAALSACYATLAAAVEAQPGLQELRTQLASALCTSSFLPAAAQLLLCVRSPPIRSVPGTDTACEAAGWQLLALALFMSGASIATQPLLLPRDGHSLSAPGCLPSSVLAARMRAESPGGGGGSSSTSGSAGWACSAAAALEAAATAAAAGPSEEDATASTALPATQLQLLDPAVQELLRERLQHAAHEMHGSGDIWRHSSLGSATAPHSAAAAAADADAAALLLLPGRVAPDGHNAFAAGLRALRVWRVLLAARCGGAVPLMGPQGLPLLLATLNGAVCDAARDCDAERQAQRGRLVRVTVDCLTLLLGPGATGLEPGLPALAPITRSLAGVLAAAGAYWDARRRTFRSTELGFTGQVRCVDRSTGDMLVRYTLAAAGAAALLAHLACGAGMLETDSTLTAAAIADAGLLPAVEQLFRQLPGVSPAHAAAAELLVRMVALYIAQCA
jgi:hypothetical protein